MIDKNIKKNYRKLIFNDRYLIFVSVVIAVIVWIITSINIGDVETKSIKFEVPITLGDQVSEQLSMQYYSLQDTIELNVTFSGAKYVIGQVDENDFTVKFDTSSVNRTGEQNIPILVTNNSNLDFDVVSTYPESIEAYFDVSMTKTFDVNVSYDEDKAANGYVFGTPVLSEDKVVLNGPKTYIDQIDSVNIDVDFGEDKDLKEPYAIKCSVEDIEFKGIGIESNYLKVYSRSDSKNELKTIAVTLPVLKVTTLPVSVDIDDAPEGIDEGMITIKYSADTIEAGVLESADISKAVLGKIDFSKVGIGETEFKFDASKMNGITLLDENDKEITVTVNVSSSYQYKYIDLKESDIQIEGLDEGEKANIKALSNYDILVIAPYDVKSSDIQLDIKCDVSEKTEDGVYPLTIRINNNDNAWVYSTYTATIGIS